LNSRTKKLLGLVITIALLAFWTLVDLNILSSIVTSYGYPFYELVTYGSWFVVIIVILFVLSWAGCLSGRKQT
jgi:hypothetical protein